MITLRVAEKFGRYPGGRYASDGPYSGEAFRNEILLPALQDARSRGTKVIVDIDGVIGFAASFLEEAFGGLVRNGDYKASDLRKLMEIDSAQSRFEIYKEAIWQYIDEAKIGDIQKPVAN